jgi:hypothetical protein
MILGIKITPDGQRALDAFTDGRVITVNGRQWGKQVSQNRMLILAAVSCGEWVRTIDLLRRLRKLNADEDRCTDDILHLEKETLVRIGRTERELRGGRRPLGS